MNFADCENEQITIPRCYGPDRFRPVTHVEFGKDTDGVIADGVFAVTEYRSNFRDW